MKNLKRILSLALAGTMLVGMMMVGASAADFTDQDSIDHKTAVDTLVALGVLEGNTDGTFNPKGELTRAEMATVIAKINNRGKAPTYAKKDTPTFADTKGHWAEAIIEYCYSFKLVNGESATRFNPEGKLTATEAARMLLNTMGYTVSDPTNWKLITEIQAREEGIDLYAGLDDEITDPSNARITRDQMAQMAYKALDADMADGNTYETTGTTKKPAYKVVLTSAGDSAITGTGAITDTTAGTKGANKATLQAINFSSAADASAVAASYGLTNSGTVHFTISLVDVDVDTTVEAVETLGHKFLAMDNVYGTLTSVVYDEDEEAYATTIGSSNTYYTDEDYSALMGQNVKVVVKRNSAGNVAKVYGVIANKGSVLFTGTIGDLPATTNANAIKVKGKEYKIDAKLASGAAMDSSNVGLYAYNVATSNGNLDSNTVADECTMKGIDTNGDGKLDRIEYLPVSAAKVTNVATKSITLTTFGRLSTEADDLEVITYEGIAKNDIVMVTPAANSVSGKIELAKAETVTGDVTGTNSTTPSTVRVNGAWYKMADGALAGTTAPSLGDKEQTLTLVNGYYVAVDGVSTSKDLVAVVKVGATAGTFDRYTPVRVLELATGEVKEIEAEETSHSFVAGKLGYMTDTDKDGLKEFVEVTSANVADLGYTGHETAAIAYAPATGTTINSNPIADDAKVIVLYNDGNASNKDDFTTAATAASLTKNAVVDGKTVKGWKMTTVGNATITLTKKVNGIAYAQVVVVAFAADHLPSAKGTDMFGYIVGDAPYKITENNVDYLTYTVWNGEENVTVKDTNTTPRNVGDIIKYADKGDGIIKSDTTAITATGAVMGYNAADGLIDISDGCTIKNITEDTTILYVDHENKVGVEGGEIVLATEDEENPGMYAHNVWYVAGQSPKTNEAVLIVVEVNNDTKTSSNDERVNVTLSGLAATSSWDVIKATYNGKDILAADFDELDGDATDDGILKVKKGSTITVTVKQKSGVSDAKLGCEVQDNGTAVDGALIETLTSGSQPTTELTIDVKVGSSAMVLTLADGNT